MKMPLSEKISPTETCLLVIDIQKDFAAPDGLRGLRGGDLSLVKLMLNNITTLIQAAKEAGVLTLYSQQIFDPSKLNKLQKEQYDLDGKLALCNPATGGHEFYEIDPPAELVFEKQTYSIFFNKEFVKTLEENNIKTIVIVGMDTQYCVEGSARHAFDLGYKIVIANDAVANNAKHRDYHENTLKLLGSTFGTATKTEDIVRIWTDVLQQENK